MKKFLFSLVILLSITTVSNAVAQSIFVQRNLNAIAHVLSTLTPQKLNALAQLLQNPDTIPNDTQELHELARFLNTITTHEAEQLEHILQSSVKQKADTIAHEIEIESKEPKGALKKFFDSPVGQTSLAVFYAGVIVCYYQKGGIQDWVINKGGTGYSKLCEFILGAILVDQFKNMLKAFSSKTTKIIIH